eukprot:SAG31_NODE_585_length_13845_cov_25.623163_10_plen_57_part_00
MAVREAAFQEEQLLKLIMCACADCRSFGPLQSALVQKKYAVRLFFKRALYQLQVLN